MCIGLPIDRTVQSSTTIPFRDTAATVPYAEFVRYPTNVVFPREMRIVMRETPTVNSSDALDVIHVSRFTPYIFIPRPTNVVWPTDGNLRLDISDEFRDFHRD